MNWNNVFDLLFGQLHELPPEEQAFLRPTLDLLRKPEVRREVARLVVPGTPAEERATLAARCLGWLEQQPAWMGSRHRVELAAGLPCDPTEELTFLLACALEVGLDALAERVAEREAAQPADAAAPTAKVEPPAAAEQEQADREARNARARKVTEVLVGAIVGAVLGQPYQWIMDRRFDAWFPPGGGVDAGEPPTTTPQETPTTAPAPTTPHPQATPRPAPKASPTRQPRVPDQKPDLVLELAPGVEMVLVHVPAGPFWMGSSDADKDAEDNEKPQHQVTLQEYWIGKYPVTVAQFAAFVRVTGYVTEAEKRDGDYTWKHPYPGGREVQDIQEHPVTEVTWEDAQAFCRWAARVTGRGVRLPSEAEWQKAYSGTDARSYPWGDDPLDDSRCNYTGRTSPVGQYSPRGDSPYGCADMAGNVWEWVRSSVCLDSGSNRLMLLGRIPNPVFLDMEQCAVYAWPGQHGLDFGFRVAAIPDASDVRASSPDGL